MNYYNKNINKLKISITDNCNLDCEYCFVEKKTNKISIKSYENALKNLFYSKGNEKLLAIYGGEVLLEFELFKKIIIFAKELEKETNKKLIITIVTNLTLLTQYHIDFLKKYGIKVEVTLLGNKKIHDTYRIKKNKTGSFDKVIENLQKLKKNISEENIGISFCIFPKFLDVTENNFDYILNLGFNHFNFEIIREYEKWTKKDYFLFYNIYSNILKKIVSNINNNKFIYINNLNWEIKYNKLSKESCPFEYLFEIDSKGNIIFSPFVLNSINKKNYIVANFENNEHYKYLNCNYLKESKTCKSCVNNYFKNYNSDVGANNITKIYNKLSINLSKYLILKSKENKNYEKYIKLIRTKYCY